MEEITRTEIGSALRSRRQELGLSLEKIAEATKIRKSYLDALEEERFEELPGQVYVIGFIQNYARYLGLPAEPLLEALAEERHAAPRKEKTLPMGEMRTLGKGSSHSSPLRWLIGVILLVLLLAAFYLVPGLLEDRRQESPATDHSTPGSLPADVAGNDRNTTEPPAGQADGTDQTAAVLEAPAELPETAASLPVVPVDGGMLKLVVNDGGGHFIITVDESNPRKYKAVPGLTLSWLVEQQADLYLEVDGSVQLWLDEQEIELTGGQSLSLVPVQGQEKGQ